MKRVAILQSDYIPWKGYFDTIAAVDECVLFDDAQFTRRSWRNRNQIKTPDGRQWITIPVEMKGKYLQKICETRIADDSWRRSHWLTLRHNYADAPYFAEYAERFESLYLKSDERMLSLVNHAFITAVCEILGIKTKITWAMDYKAHGSKTERLVSLCKAAEGTYYLSGPSASEFIVPEMFRDAGVALAYIDYADYPVYPQLYGPFEHNVSIVDLIFNTGPSAPRYMKHVIG